MSANTPQNKNNKNIHSKQKINLKINGREYYLEIAPGMMLADVLREELKMTEVKIGCHRGECGACTVLIENKTYSACMFPAIRASGKNITTVKGLQKKSKLHPLQKAFIEEGAIQCGFCTPGMILSAKQIIVENPNLCLEDVKKGLSGNLCRCGGYQKIFKAIIKAAKK